MKPFMDTTTGWAIFGMAHVIANTPQKSWQQVLPDLSELASST
tara:strand:- start:44 stop:172 length:129 start_codon:yes stop_codon:yes gene_type:complete